MNKTTQRALITGWYINVMNKNTMIFTFRIIILLIFFSEGLLEKIIVAFRGGLCYFLSRRKEKKTQASSDPVFWLMFK